VRELLPCLYARERGEPAPDLLDGLRLERARVDAAIRGLEGTRDALDTVIGNADRRRPGPRPTASGSPAPDRDLTAPGRPSRSPTTG